MRLSRLPAVLVAAVLTAGVASCATSVDGSGTIASDVVTGGPTPTSTDSSSADPSESAASESPTPDPTSASPTVDPVKTREVALCVLERAAITSINSQFNASKNRSGQIKILKSGVTTIKGHITRSSLPASDTIRSTGQGVLDQLNKLATAASGGNSPSTTPYNAATQKFQKACNSIS